MPAAPLKADELFAAWSRNQFHSVYLFSGTEDFLIEEAVQNLLAQRFPNGPDDTNRERLDAEKCSAGEILQVCQTLPFGGSWRWVEVRNASKLDADDQKQLAEGLSNFPPTTQLVLIWGKEWRRDDAERPLVKAVMKAGAVGVFWPMFPENAQRWLVQRARHYKKTLAPGAAAWLVGEAGEGLRQLDQELAKACGYVGSRTEITQEDLELCFGYRKALSPYEWLTAIRQKKADASFRTLQQLLADDEEPLKLLAIATSSLREWIQVKENGGGNSWRKDAEQVMRDLQRRPVEDLVEGLSCCVEAHQTIKSGKETPEMALTLLTLRLCGLESLNAGR